MADRKQTTDPNPIPTPASLKPRISVITGVLNGVEHIADCIESVLGQNLGSLEYIVVDGGSTDGTVEVIKRYRGRITSWISERDAGIYDALNKGIRLATGEIIGFLHADDIYAHDRVLETVDADLARTDAQSCYGDVVYVDRRNAARVIRTWKSSPYRPGLLRTGWMPPHPTFFVRREIYEKLGGFNTDFRIAADYELMLRFLERGAISTHYIPEVLVKMRWGGASNRSIASLWRKSREDLRAMKMHRVGGLATLLRKNVSKIPQFFTGPARAI
jgi:glycosyltransferase involved in cell wall biosynthesis